jgi:hypothetical protein
MLKIFAAANTIIVVSFPPLCSLGFGPLVLKQDNQSTKCSIIPSQQRNQYYVFLR